MSEPTGFLGLSHLGIVSSIGWASMGETVIAVDLDGGPVGALQAGPLPVHEPGLEDLFASVRDRFSVATDPAALSPCGLVVISRDVPTDSGNQSDPGPVLELVEAALPHFRQDVTLVLMSQVPPGFTRDLAERVRTRRPDLRFRLYYWIETLIFGQALERFLKPERIMVGCADPSAPLPVELETVFRKFGCPVLRMSYESAELTKIAINLYLCGAVTYANTLADLCEAVGADWQEMVPALKLDRRIGPGAYLRPSLGIAGGNLERDMVTLRGLCRAQAVDAAYIETLIDYNERRRQWVHRQLRRHVLARRRDPVVGVWGLAYKKNTRSTKNSMSLRVIGDLQGVAEVRAYDPAVTVADVEVTAKICPSREDAVAGADCLLILTDWDEFAAPAVEMLRTMRSPIVIDCVGVIDARRLTGHGIECVAMGRGAR